MCVIVGNEGWKQEKEMNQHRSRRETMYTSSCLHLRCTGTGKHALRNDNGNGECGVRAMEH